MQEGARVSRIALAAILGALLFATSAASFLVMSEHNHDGAPIGGCPFMFAEPVLCDMGVLEHLSLWQMLFMALPVELFVLVLLALALVCIFRRHYLWGPPIVRIRQSQFEYGSLPHNTAFAALLLGTTIHPCAP